MGVKARNYVDHLTMLSVRCLHQRSVGPKKVPIFDAVAVIAAATTTTFDLRREQKLFFIFGYTLIAVHSLPGASGQKF